jgi:hypothetical protein
MSAVASFLFDVAEEVFDAWDSVFEGARRRVRAKQEVKKALQIQGETVHVGGTTLYNVHRRGRCLGPSCWIHRPTQHHMRDWPRHWRGDRHLLERICQHGVGHPDPDQPFADSTHGCCGCCYPAHSPE